MLSALPIAPLLLAMSEPPIAPSLFAALGTVFLLYVGKVVAKGRDRGDEPEEMDDVDWDDGE